MDGGGGGRRGGGGVGHKDAPVVSAGRGDAGDTRRRLGTFPLWKKINKEKLTHRLEFLKKRISFSERSV